MDYNELTPIVEKAQSGDKGAMNQLLETIYQDIYYHAKKSVRDEHLAYDVTQEVCMEVFKKLKTLRAPNLFPVWVKRILFNKCASHFRGEKDILVDVNDENETFLDEIPDTDDTHLPEAVLEDKEFCSTLLELVDSLPEEQRSATVLYYYERMSVNQISTIQGVNVDTVKSRLRYSRKALRTKIEEYEQKTGTKLHGVAILPLLMQAFFKQDFAATAMPNIAESVGAACAAAGGTAAATATATAAGVSGATGTTGTAVAKGVGMGLTAKIVAGIVAAGVVIGGAVGTTALIRNRNEKEDDKTEESSKKADLFGEPYTVYNDTTQVEGVWRFMEGQWMSSEIEADFDASQAYDFTFNLDGSVTVQDKTYACVGEPVYHSGHDKNFGTGFDYYNAQADYNKGEHIEICGLKVESIYFKLEDNGKYTAELEIRLGDTHVARLEYYRVSDYNDNGSVRDTDENGNHLHVFDSNWKYDAYEHWRECGCGVRSYSSSHFGEDSRSEYENCIVCDYHKGEEVDGVGDGKAVFNAADFEMLSGEWICLNNDAYSFTVNRDKTITIDGKTSGLKYYDRSGVGGEDGIRYDSIRFKLENPIAFDSRSNSNGITRENAEVTIFQIVIIDGGLYQIELYNDESHKDVISSAKANTAQFYRMDDYEAVQLTPDNVYDYIDIYNREEYGRFFGDGTVALFGTKYDVAVKNGFNFDEITITYKANQLMKNVSLVGDSELISGEVVGTTELFDQTLTLNVLSHFRSSQSVDIANDGYVKADSNNEIYETVPFIEIAEITDVDGVIYLPKIWLN